MNELDGDGEGVGGGHRGWVSTQVARSIWVDIVRVKRPFADVVDM
jgi:hypothetical protein